MLQPCPQVSPTRLPTLIHNVVQKVRKTMSAAFGPVTPVEQMSMVITTRGHQMDLRHPCRVKMASQVLAIHLLQLQPLPWPLLSNHHPHHNLLRLSTIQHVPLPLLMIPQPGRLSSMHWIRDQTTGRVSRRLLSLSSKMDRELNRSALSVRRPAKALHLVRRLPVIFPSKLLKSRTGCRCHPRPNSQSLAI